MVVWVGAWTVPVEAGEPTAGEAVSFVSSDGVKLQGRWYAAAKARPGAVLYLHMATRSGEDYRFLAARVASKGLPGLTLDLRGHGGSRQTVAGGTLDRANFTPAEWKASLADVTAAVKWLREVRKVDPRRIQIVGADFGATLAVEYGAGDPAIAALALLSPGLAYQEMSIRGRVAAYGQRPLLVVASEDDAYSLRSAQVMQKEALGKNLVKTFPAAGHGTRMLNTEGSLEEFILSWLMGTLTADGGTVGQGAEMETKPKSVEGTSGRDLSAEEKKRLEDQQKQVDTGTQAIDKQEAPKDDGTPKRWE